MMGSAAIPVTNAAGDCQIPFRPPGRLSHKWVEDFIISGLATEDPNFVVGCAVKSQPHNFELMKDQLVSTTLREAGPYYAVIVSSICLTCRHHFIFRIEAPSGRLCGSLFGNSDKPLHHLMVSPLQSKDFASCRTDQGRDLRYLQCCGHAAYECSADECTFRILVEVSQPRLPAEHIRALKDNAAVKERLQRGKQEEPERYVKMTDDNLAGKYLTHYLSDVVKRPENRRSERINTRNVKFAVNFGTDQAGTDLFDFLGFSKREDEGNEFWFLPLFDFTQPTVVPSAQSFYQDVLAEVLAIMGQRISDEPIPSLKEYLKESLHCSENQYTGIETKPKFATTASQLSDYELLGMTPTTHWRFFEFAYDCQTRLDHSLDHRKAYFKALKAVGAPHNQESLSMRIATLESMLEASTTEAMAGSGGTSDDAWRALDTRTATEIIGEYKNKFENASMAQNKQIGARKKVDLRMELEKLARYREDSFLMDAVREPMELEEAAACLELPMDPDQLKGMDAEILHGLASGQSQQEKGGLMAGMALERIAIYIGNEALTHMARDMINASLNLSIIPEAPVVNLELPVGLENIRNTCYLNSILQYLFTVNPVRDIVLDWERYKLPDSEEVRKQRHISTKQGGISVGEAFTAEQFVNELRSLFNDLKSTPAVATKPTQKLALAAMNSAEQLETRKPAHAPVQGPLPAAVSMESLAAPPPLPARPAPTPPGAQPGDGTGEGVPTSEHAEHAEHVEKVETGSNISSQTLVNQNEDEADHGYVNIDHQPVVGGDLPPSWGNLKRVNSVASSGRSSMICEISPDDLDDRPIESFFEENSAAVSAGGADIVMTDGGAPAPDPSQQQSPAGVIQAVEGTEETEPIDPVARIEKALNDSSVSGTDQQDVQEVMGKMLYHLQAAIKPTGEDPDTNAQTDLITSILYLTKVEHRKHPGDTKWLETVIPEAWLLAYPPSSGTISLHEALDNAFRRELIDQDQPNPWYHFGSIRKFPPILHICIQRSGDNGRKNDSPIKIPQVLYMDRYQESPPGSDLLKRRHQSWDLYSRIQQHGMHEATVVATAAASMTNGASNNNIKAAGPEPEKAAVLPDDWLLEMYDGIVAQRWNTVKSPSPPAYPASSAATPAAKTPSEASEGTTSGEQMPPHIEDTVSSLIPPPLSPPLAPPPPPASPLPCPPSGPLPGPPPGPPPRYPLPEKPKTFAWESTAAPATDVEAFRREADSLFDHLRSHEYHLHAVVCHMGKTGSSGHYWVWIYDFEEAVWRKYNDSSVAVVADNDTVMAELSASGEPYYLAYVRRECVAEMVSIPRRAPPPADAMDVCD